MYFSVGVAVLVFSPVASTAEAGTEDVLDAVSLAPIIALAEGLEPIETLLVSHRGEVVLAHGFDGHSTTAPYNIKSASKPIISALVGIAIDRGVLEGVDQPIAPLLADVLPEDPDPRLAEVTIGHLLSMQAGLTRTSNEYYAEWVASPHWVEYALAQPFADDPGGAMQYSTGSTHLLSAILTRETGQSTLDLARNWLSGIAGFAISGWDSDPQGIYLGGNNMAMTPASLLAFGEIYRNGGRTPDGEQIVPSEWIAESWIERTRSRLNGDGYGYGWFLRQAGDELVYYGWGFGGQMLYVVPGVELTVVVTSDEFSPSAGTGYLDNLAGLLDEIVVLARQTQGEPALSPEQI